MSIYSTTTESNINKPILNDELNYQKLQKFNKFYLTNNNFSCKDKSKIAPTTKVDNLFIMDIPLTPRTTTLAKTNIKKTHSRNYSTHKTLTKYKTYNNYNRMKKMFNPDILEGQYISKPKKKKIKNCRIEMPKYNTFLASKIKGKSLGIKIANCITGNLSKFIIPDNYKKNDEFRGSKLLAEKKRKKAMANVFNQFKQKLNYDKRENLYEYNKFMNSLKINLNLAKYRNSNNEFVYE